MSNKFRIIRLALLMLCLNGKAWGSLEDTTLTVITWYEAQIPISLGKQRVDILVKELETKLPTQLQTAIKKLPASRGRVEFLDRSSELIKLKKAVDYESAAALVTTIPKVVSQPANAFLFTKIDIGSGTIVFHAKIVKIGTLIQSEDEVEFEQTKAFIPGIMRSSIQELAESLLKQVLPVPKREKSLYCKHERFLNYPTISSGALSVGSLVWYLIEDGNVSDSYSSYRSSMSVEDATKSRIKTEKAFSRRQIAGTSAIVSGVAFGFFLMRDIFWQRDTRVDSSEAEQNLHGNPDHGLKMCINPLTSKDGILIRVALSF